MKQSIAFETFLLGFFIAVQVHSVHTVPIFRKRFLLIESIGVDKKPNGDGCHPFENELQR